MYATCPVARPARALSYGAGRDLWELHRRPDPPPPWLATATVAVDELANEHATIRLHD